MPVQPFVRLADEMRAARREVKAIVQYLLERDAEGDGYVMLNCLREADSADKADIALDTAKRYAYMFDNLTLETEDYRQRVIEHCFQKWPGQGSNLNWLRLSTLHPACQECGSRLSVTNRSVGEDVRLCSSCAV